MSLLIEICGNIMLCFIGLNPGTSLNQNIIISQLLNQNIINHHKNKYNNIHVGLVQIAVTRYSNVFLLDVRATRFYDSIISMIDSNLMNCLVYFNSFLMFYVN